MNKIWLIYIILPIQAFSQYTITGTIADSLTHLPIEYATVYINGTTIGTISDTSGNFYLNKFE